MSFLKANSHWVGLCALTTASLAGTFFLYQAEQDLPSRLSSLQPRPVKPKPVPELDLTPIENSSKLLAKPSLWKTDYTSFLFVSDHYLIEEGQLKKPVDGSRHYHSKTRQPIPNSWFLKHKLTLFSPRIPLEDTDGDGFTNEEEWLAGSDPTDPKSHPPLVGKLLYTNQKVVNNRVTFLQYLGKKMTVRPEDLPGDKKQYDLQIGDTVPGTDFVLKSFEVRRRPDPSGTFSLDASVLTFADKKSGRIEPAEVKASANFTDRTLYFKLAFKGSEKEFTAKPGEKIVLDETESYELIDASATSARLKSAAGAEIEINSTPK